MSRRPRAIVIVLAILFALVAPLMGATSAQAGGTTTQCPENYEGGAPGDGVLYWTPGQKPVAQVFTLGADGCLAMVVDTHVRFVVKKTKRGRAYVWTSSSSVMFVSGEITLINPYSTHERATVELTRKRGKIYRSNLPRFVHGGKVVMGKVTGFYMSFIDRAYTLDEAYPGPKG